MKILYVLIFAYLNVDILAAQHTVIHKHEKKLLTESANSVSTSIKKSSKQNDFQIQSLIELVKSECQSAQLVYKRRKYGFDSFGISPDSALDRAYNIFLNLDKSGDSVLFKSVADEAIRPLISAAQVLRRTDVILKITSLMAIHYPSDIHCHCGKCENKN